MGNETKSGRLATLRNRFQSLLRLWIFRAEIVILFFGLAFTAYGKLIIIRRQHTPDLFFQLMPLVFPDIFFFASVVLLIFCLYLLKPSAFTARLTIIIATLVTVWSVLNTAWLTKSGVQLQPGILIKLIGDFKELWPLVRTHLRMPVKRILPPAIVLFVGGGYFLLRLIRPTKVNAARIHLIGRIAQIGLLLIVLLLAKVIVQGGTDFDITREALNFSSHWHALVSTVTGLGTEPSSEVQGRYIPEVGQREVVCPTYPSSELPNIVFVLLESVPYSETSLANPEIETTPCLARIAREGVEFRLTRAPAPYTGKVIWTILTSTTPVIRFDYIEAVPLKKPCESLVTILNRIGYRSAFFKMAKGSFECAPSLCKNLGFDWAWFRENLEDPSVYLGYLAGDDCCMIEPAFEWILEESRPFLLMMLTSVTHDPYELPEGYNKPGESSYKKYLKALKYTDYFLEQVCQKLKVHDLERNTILCVLGDHGTSFRVGAARHGRWFPYEEVIRVPWVIRWPGHLDAGETIEWPCADIDVAPTILKLIGFDISQAGFEGKDALIPSKDNRRLYFSCVYQDGPSGYVEGNKKVIYWPYIGQVFLYDLKTDPGELSPVEVSSNEAEQIKRDVQAWQKASQMQILISGKRYRECFLYSHWQVFSSGHSAWAYYVP